MRFFLVKLTVQVSFLWENLNLERVHRDRKEVKSETKTERKTEPRKQMQRWRFYNAKTQRIKKRGSI